MAANAYLYLFAAATLVLLKNYFPIQCSGTKYIANMEYSKMDNKFLMIYRELLEMKCSLRRYGGNVYLRWKDKDGKLNCETLRPRLVYRDGLYVKYGIFNE